MTHPANVPATTDPSQIAVQDPDAWWDGGDDVEGHDLLKDESLFQLVGVPFKGFRVQFRDGVQRKGVDYRDDYASLELRAAPAKVFTRDMPRIKSRRDSHDLPTENAGDIAYPDEQLVINDGSTGVYRQIVQYLRDKGIITLPDGPEEGEKGESIFDLPRSQWLSGAEAATDGIDIDLRCSRGLRYSEYESEYLPAGERARTWYIA